MLAPAAVGSAGIGERAARSGSRSAWRSAGLSAGLLSAGLLSERDLPGLDYAAGAGY